MALGSHYNVYFYFNDEVVCEARVWAVSESMAIQTAAPQCLRTYNKVTVALD